MPACLGCGTQLPVETKANVCPDCAHKLAAIQAQYSPAGRPSVLQRMPVTSAIVGINALVFVAMTLSGVSPAMPQSQDLIRWGAEFGPVTLTTQPWRLLTSNYVHIGIVHIALNMWCLWNLGALSERVFDRWTYFLTYTACGLAGSILSLWFHPVGVGAGASGAIFGMAGALIAALYLGKLPVAPHAMKATLRSLLSFAGYNLFFGTVIPGIDNSAHLGGLVTGLALGAALAPRLTAPPDERQSWRFWVFVIAGVMLLLLFELIRHSVGHPVPAPA